MQIVAYPCLVMASLSAFAGFLHLFVFFRGRRVPAHLPFALLCVSVAVYDVFSIGLYTSSSVAEGVRWQKLQLDTMDIISVCITWFVARYTNRTGSRILRAVAGWFALVFIVSLVAGPDFTLSPLRPSIKTIAIPGLPLITYFEGELGIVYLAGIASAVLLYVYLLAVLVSNYVRSRTRGLLVVIVGMSTYFLGVANDSLVAARVYPFIYLSEYSFMIVVLTMSWVLLGELAQLYHRIEDTNATLEARVEERTREITKLNEDLRRQAERDSLTGIYNRRFFSQYLEIELRRARNRLEHRTVPLPEDNDMNFGLAMVDIDHFKRINDTYGHPAGDRAIVEVVAIIQEVIFSRDVFCRYGGEEFVILFTRTSREGIVQAIEKIRRRVDEHAFVVDDDHEAVRITVSIGVVIFEEVPQLTTQQLLRIADHRLLEAKEGGRNRVVYTSR